MASMKMAAYTPNSGRAVHACISSTTLSVIREIVSLPMLAPYTSAKCAQISPVVNPLAYNEIAIASTSLRRRCLFLTMTGANVPARSRGTSMVTSPAASVRTVLGRVPLRMFPAPPDGARCFSCPRCSVISSSRAASRTVAVIVFNSPSGPVRSSPRERAALTSSRTASRSTWPGFRLFVASLGIELMPVSVSVIGDQPSSPTLGRRVGGNTVRRTVPRQRA